MGKRLFLVLSVLSAAAAAVASGRTWTDASGQHQVEADFLTAQYGKYWFLRADGRVFGIELSELSRPDQQYVRKLVRQKQSEQQRATQNPPGRVPYGRGRELCRLKNRQIAESSGLACSRRRPGFFWTHNDSGGRARVFLFDLEGRDLGSCELTGVFNYDFEDIFSFRARGKSYLVLCDVGNNGRAAAVQLLHVIEEPAFDPQQGVAADAVPVVKTIYYCYEDDHRDCEAVGIDPTTQTLLFVTKQRRGGAYVYELRWPESDAAKAWPAKRIATLSIPMVTALDVSPDGRRAVVLTYGNAYEYVRGAGDDWAEAFAREPRVIVVPERIQGESICCGADGKTLYLTSEKLPTPLLMVPAKE